MCSTPIPDDAPKYLKNTTTRRNGVVVEYAYTRIDGQRISLGRFGSPDGYEKWQQLRTKWLAARQFRLAPEPSGLTVAELIERWLDHEKARAEAGRISATTYAAARAVAEAALSEHAGLAVTAFGPKALKTIQARLVTTPCKTNHGRFRGSKRPPHLSRTEVNRRINGIRRAFRWGVSEELVPQGVLASLVAVPGLRAGEGRDNPARQPSNPAHVRRLASELRNRGHHGHASVLELLRWTGCRPDEICTLTAMDVTATPLGLELRIRKHKTRKATGSDRVVPLNRQAAEIVGDAISNARSINPNRRLFLSKTGRPFNSHRFYWVLRQTADAAGIDRVEPYGLRHLGATEAIEAGMSEAEAAALLGHTPNSTIVRRYSQDRTALARRAANAIGGREAG